MSSHNFCGCISCHHLKSTISSGVLAGNGVSTFGIFLLANTALYNSFLSFRFFILSILLTIDCSHHFLNDSANAFILLGGVHAFDRSNKSSVDLVGVGISVHHALLTFQYSHQYFFTTSLCASNGFFHSFTNLVYIALASSKYGNFEDSTIALYNHGTLVNQ
jgi:hypothetical protein